MLAWRYRLAHPPKHRQGIRKATEAQGRGKDCPEKVEGVLKDSHAMSGFSVSAFGAASCRSGKHVNMVTTNFRIRNSRWQNPLPGAVNFRREFSLSSVLASGSNRQLKASQPPYNILFCGNDPFSVSVLDAVWRRKGKCNPAMALQLACR